MSDYRDERIEELETGIGAMKMLSDAADELQKAEIARLDALVAEQQKVIGAAREVVEVWGPTASHVMTGLTAALLALEGTQ